jgi:transcriptional regulator with XRE-family HTH domain
MASWSAREEAGRRREKGVEEVVSFGSLLRELRGTIPLKELARRVGLSDTYLSNVEAGRRTLSEEKARSVLERGFGLAEDQSTRLILETKLLDYGIKGEIRELVADLIQDTLPQGLRRELLKLYHNAAAKSGK